MPASNELAMMNVTIITIEHVLFAVQRKLQWPTEMTWHDCSRLAWQRVAGSEYAYLIGFGITCRASAMAQGQVGFRHGSPTATIGKTKLNQ